jgi:predicted N-formylglutamate amidohydrolase
MSETSTPRSTFAAPLRLDPSLPPVIERKADGRSAFLFTGDHYGRLVPPQLGDLGVQASEWERHIACDIGIAGVAERLAKLLDAQMIAQRYSRLVIDCNRPPEAASSIPVISEATGIPGNVGLTAAQAAERRALIFDPYHDRINAAIDARLAAGRPTVLVALHSFTPSYSDVARPWHIGTLYQHDRVLPPLLLAALRAETALVVGDNQPYGVSDDSDYTIPVHGERRGLINSGIEIRQDLIADEAGQQAWAERLARAFASIEAALRARGFISSAD